MEPFNVYKTLDTRGAYLLFMRNDLVYSLWRPHLYFT